MTDPAVVAGLLDGTAINDCWNVIGVRGDGSCAELTQYVHCRNCPVYSAGAAMVLDASAPVDYLADRTVHFAAAPRVREGETRSVVIFRVASEWLALPTSVVVEVANLLPIHSLPHRPDGVVLGLASVRGELLVCVSLSRIIGAAAAPASFTSDARGTYRRLLVIRREALQRKYAAPGEALLAMEVMSPSSVSTDRIAKPSQYASAGIPHFWRYEPSTQELMTYALVGDVYRETGRFTDEVAVEVPVPLRFRLADLLP